ncbi:MAG: hypothetical protein ACKOPE_01945 [Novosphingobium sp.]
MRNLAVIAGIAMLAACGGQKTATPEPTASEAAEAVATDAAAVQTPAAGTYDVVAPDGTKGTSTLNADGTYSDNDASGKVTAKGTWAIKDGKTCFRPEGAKEECYTESPRAADGSFTAVDAKGGVTKVSPQAK